MEQIEFSILSNNEIDIKNSVLLAAKAFNPKADLNSSIDRLKNMINDKNCLVFVAKYNKQVVGFVYANITARILSGTNLATLWCLCVDENFRNKGIASGLLNFACAECKKNNCNEVKLTTLHTNYGCQKASEKSNFKQGLSYTKEI